MRALFFLLAVLILLAPRAEAGNIPLGEPFIIGVGERVQVGDLPLSVTFDTILEDSRCPKDAICIWEGEATAQLGLSTPLGESTSVELHTRPSPFGPSRVEFAEHVVILRQVLPYPTVREPINPEDYKVELVVDLVSVVTTHTQTWSALKSDFR
jgi:hypothetical protein